MGIWSLFNGWRCSANTVWLLSLFVLSTANSQQATAQSVSATLRADSTELMIGDPVHVNLSVKYSKGLQLTMPAVADTLGSMEVSSVSPIDTIAEGNNYILSRTYTVSAYDSGEYYAGPVQIIYKNSAGLPDTILSNEVVFTVNTLDVDTTQPFKAIKAPLDIPYVWQEFTYYIIGAVLLLIALIAGILLWRRYKNKKPVVAERYRPKDAAHVWARKELKKLEEEKLWQNDKVKQYYSRLTDILRLYLEYRYHWMALESTTEEIVEELPKYGINDVAKTLMLDSLRAADLVKFAKMMPAPDANIRAMDNVKQFVEMTALAETNMNETANKK